MYASGVDIYWIYFTVQIKVVPVVQCVKQGFGQQRGSPMERLSVGWLGPNFIFSIFEMILNPSDQTHPTLLGDKYNIL